MAYAGTTSTAPNPPMMVGQIMSGPRSWKYESTHTQAEAAGTGFFTDGSALGMLNRDRVQVVGSTTLIFSDHSVVAVTTTGATLSAGLMVSSAT